MPELKKVVDIYKLNHMDSLCVNYMRPVEGKKVFHYQVPLAEALLSNKKPAFDEVVKKHIEKDEDSLVQFIPIAKNQGDFVTDMTDQVLGDLPEVKKRLGKHHKSTLFQDLKWVTYGNDLDIVEVGNSLKENFLKKVSLVVDKINVFLRKIPLVNIQFSRPFELMRTVYPMVQLSYRYANTVEEEKEAIRKLRKDLILLTSLGVVKAHLMMPTKMLLSSLAFKHEDNVNTLFCMIHVDSGKLYKVLGRSINEGSVRDHDIYPQIGIEGFTYEGNVGPFVTQDPLSKYEIENVVLRDQVVDHKTAFELMGKQHDELKEKQQKRKKH